MPTSNSSLFNSAQETLAPRVLTHAMGFGRDIASGQQAT